MRASVLANLASSALTLSSIFLPWIRFNTGQIFSAVQATDASLAVILVVTGGAVSLLSRYGGLLTMTGVWLFVASPPRLNLMLAYNAVITSSFEIGVWLAWTGATLSLLGGSWSLPFGLTKEESRKRFGLIVFPLGVVLMVFGSMTAPPGSLIFILDGLILLGLGVFLLLSPRGRTLAQILKGLVGTSKRGQKN